MKVIQRDQQQVTEMGQTHEGNPEGPATGEVENKEEPGSSKTILERL